MFNAWLLKRELLSLQVMRLERYAYFVAASKRPFLTFCDQNFGIQPGDPS